MVIGKFALESITTGMYINPLDVLREYIQNSADAIDIAIQNKYVTRSSSKITISIDPLQKRVTIEDNGIGISSQYAQQVLTDIGNSFKLHTENRGFRGIGRLSGLSYANNLTFRTTFPNENVGTEVAFDAKQFRHLLSQHNNNSYTAENTIDQICSSREFKVNPNAHFFTVVLDGVDPASGLLDEEKVVDYLCQTSPVGYDSSIFSWSATINQEISIATYNVFLNSVNGTKQILKPYCDTLLINKTTGETDHIKDIHFSSLTDTEGKYIGHIWYAITDFKGSLHDKQLKGLRIRVGNISLSDSQSLNQIFKDSRFNGWVSGEIHIYSSDLVPNARRDDFEHNKAYFRLEEQLRAIASEITQRIRSSSVARNRALASADKKVDQLTEDTNKQLSDFSVSSSTCNSLEQEIAKLKTEVETIPVKPNEARYKEEILNKLDILTGRVKGTTKYRVINLLPNLTNAEKTFLAHLFQKISETQTKKKAENLMNTLIELLKN